MVVSVSEQCGEEIAQHIRTLGERILLHMGCELRKRMYLCFQTVLFIAVTCLV